MTSWRDTILQNFKLKNSRLTLVADPDGLLTEEGMLTAIKDRGFDLIPFADPIAFRYEYESQYRRKWDTGQSTDLVVVLRSADSTLEKLPFDLLKAGLPLSFALHKLFPNLNPRILAGLDRVYLDAVDEAYQKYDGDQLTERGTKEFVLKSCFKIVPDMVGTPVDLLKMLLSLHSRQVRLPEVLAEHLLESLLKEPAFANWPLADLLTSRKKFLRFLQEEWQNFLAAQGNKGLACRVPFSHEDVRAYIDTLFLDGSLTPVEREGITDLPEWMAIGVAHDPAADAVRRFRGLHEKFAAQLPGVMVPHREWQQAAQRWAELVVLRWEWDQALDAADRTAWETLQGKVEASFGEWMQSRYGTLYNLAYHQQPVMVHQIAHFLAVERRQKKLKKVALLVMDGLAFDQWILLRNQLQTADASWRFQESSCFAWVPTLTSVTRQSIFAGEPPFFFPDSLHTTAKERSHWLRFWEDHDVPRSSIELVTNIQGADDPEVCKACENSKLSILGLVWNQVDNIADKMVLKTAGLHNQVRLWGSQGALNMLLKKLYDTGFSVYLTADHGNVSATGVGNPQEGILVETKGRRARTYARREFLEDVQGKFPSSIPWANYGLPEDRYVLLPGGLTAFANPGEEVVAHGGISLEEVMVPFVSLTREGE